MGVSGQPETPSDQQQSRHRQSLGQAVHGTLAVNSPVQPPQGFLQKFCGPVYPLAKSVSYVILGVQYM